MACEHDVQHLIWIDNGKVRAQGAPRVVLPKTVRLLTSPDVMYATQI
jgi:hypothetical protein